MTQRVLVISGDVLPLPGYPTTGAGLRAWGLGQGLRANGFEVAFSMPRLAWRAELTAPLDFELDLWEHHAMADMIAGLRPEAVVFCHWPAVQIPGRLDVPTVLDFHGPHMLERMFQSHGEAGANAIDKIRALRKIDYFICPAHKQRPYFWTWLMLSGFDLTSVQLDVVPVCLSPELPARVAEPVEPEFVFGGVYLPWQDPTRALRVVARTLAARGRGRLEIYGGRHPNYPIAVPPQFEALERDLATNPRVSFHGMRPHRELVERYTGATVAVDLMSRNPERELAFTTRTVEYLWCGLPVIYNDYAELAGPIRDYDAGWVLDPEDEAGMQRTVDEIFDAPETVRVKARNGQRLVREKLAWDRAVAPLVKYLHAPARQLPAGDLPAFVAGELGVMNYWSRAPSRSLRSMWSTARQLYAIGGWRHLAGESVNFVKRGIARTRHGQSRRGVYASED
jgi:glycosyltransferase involved in cell wall biosynthesis